MSERAEESPTQTIESQMDGEFSGFDGSTVFTLTNGQKWQQASYSYSAHSADRPRVRIERAGAGHLMYVEGLDKPIAVRRLDT
jgi:hypothetical protein